VAPGFPSPNLRHHGLRDAVDGSNIALLHAKRTYFKHLSVSQFVVTVSGASIASTFVLLVIMILAVRSPHQMLMIDARRVITCMHDHIAFWQRDPMLKHVGHSVRKNNDLPTIDLFAAVEYTVSCFIARGLPFKAFTAPCRLVEESIHLYPAFRTA